MKVVLFIASTLNGFIARKNGEEDFLEDDNWTEFSKLAEKCSGIIVGRKTYQIVQRWKNYNFDNIDAKKIIVSRNSKLKLSVDKIYASSPQEALTLAEKMGIKVVLLAGGGELNFSFLKNNLIDEIIVNINPFLLGRGIKIFSEYEFEKKLKLIAVKNFSSDIIQLHYKLKR